MTLRLTEVMYIVDDLETAIGFYTEHLGCTLIKAHDWGFAYLAIEPGKNLGLMTKQCSSQDSVFHGDSLAPRLSFGTDDLDAELDRLTAAGARIGAVSGKKGETRAANVYDRSGNAIFVWEDGTGELPSDPS